MVESAEESKQQQPQAAAEEEEKKESYLCEKDGRDHGHVQEGASWSTLLGELG